MSLVSNETKEPVTWRDLMVTQGHELLRRERHMYRGSILGWLWTFPCWRPDVVMWCSGQPHWPRRLLSLPVMWETGDQNSQSCRDCHPFSETSSLKPHAPPWSRLFQMSWTMSVSSALCRSLLFVDVTETEWRLPFSLLCFPFLKSHTIRWSSLSLNGITVYTH